MNPDAVTIDIPHLAEPHRIHCWRWGNPQAAHTVLCAHGLTRNGRDFDFLAAALSGDYQVLCPDMPGRGESPPLNNPLLYNYPTYVFDLQCVLAELNIDRVHWVGTSMGGILGMMMANTMPGLLTSLVLNDVGCVVSREGLSRILSYAGTSMVFDTPALAEAELRRICAPFGIVNEGHWQHLFSHSLKTREDGKITFAFDPALVNGLPAQEVVQDIDLWSLWEMAKPVRTLLIRGEHSDILTRDTAERMQATHPDLTYREIPNAGHAPALMADDQIQLIRSWLVS